jgi:hypothetical protein
MWQEPIVNERVRTALDEGITSQSAARARRDRSASDSFLRRLLHSIARLCHKKPRQTRDTQKSFGFQQSEETIR